MDALKRSHVTVVGSGTAPLIFAHGFGCDQSMWRFVAPAFLPSHRLVLFDHIGCGHADPTAFDAQRHATLDGYARDVLDILEALDLHDVSFVGHSVSAMIGVLASLRAPGRIGRLIMLGPSPRYLNDPPDYVGGFDPADIDGLLDMMETNMLGWVSYLAPVVMGADRPEVLIDELKASFCQLDPTIARRFAETTFRSDNRADLAQVTVPALVVQLSDDAIAPPEVGRYVHQQLAGSRFVQIDGSGHCPHMTHPDATIAAIRAFLASA